MFRSLALCSTVFVALFFAALNHVPFTSVAGAFFISESYAAAGNFPALGIITRGPVNVRAGANTNFESIDKLAQGAQVVVLAQNYEWYKIQLPATAAAYIRADYIQVLEHKTGAVIGNRVNIRAKPNSESSTIGQLGKGEMIKLLDKINEWWKIEPAAGIVGWVHKDFLRLDTAQIPADLVRKHVIVNVGVVSPPAAAAQAPSTPVSVRGKVEVMAETMPDLHYQISVDGKVVYYLQDAPHLDRFKNIMVTLDGTVKNTSHDYPVLQVNKISMLL